MSYRSDLKCMASFMVETKDSWGRVWFTLPAQFPLKCHDCDKWAVCRLTLGAFAGIVNEDKKIKEARETVARARNKTLGDVLIPLARSI